MNKYINWVEQQSDKGFHFIKHYEQERYLEVHHRCGTVLLMKKEKLENGQGCPFCLDKNFNKSDYSFESDLVSRTGKSYEVLHHYENEESVTLKHLKCGELFTIKIDIFRESNYECSCCGEKEGDIRILNIEDFQTPKHQKFLEEITTHTANEFKFFTPYKKSTDKLFIYHEVCDSFFEISANTFKKNISCKNCKRKIIPETVNLKGINSQEEMASRIGKIRNGEFKLLSKYKGSQRTVYIKHKQCGNVNIYNYSSFIKIQKCAACEYTPRALPPIEDGFVVIPIIIKDTYEKEIELDNNNHSITPQNQSLGVKNTKEETLTKEEEKEPMAVIDDVLEPNEFVRKKLTDKYGDVFEIRSFLINLESKVVFFHNKCKKGFYSLPLSLIENGICLSCNEKVELVSKEQQEKEEITSVTDIVLPNEKEFLLKKAREKLISLGYIKQEIDNSIVGVDELFVKENSRIIVLAVLKGQEIGLSSVQEIVSSKYPLGANQGLIVSNQEFTNAAKVLAEVNNINLLVIK